MLQRFFASHLHKLCFLFLIALFFESSTSAQTDSASLFFKNYSTANGLSDNKVNCIFKDSHGFVWIGTVNGLNRFDGTNFKIFKNEINDSLSLPFNNVFSLSEDGKKNLWVSTTQGLCKYDFKTQTFKRYFLNVRNDTTTVKINSAYLFLDSKNNFWITTYGYGLLLYDNLRDSLIQYPLPDKNFPKTMYGMAEDGKHNLWIACYNDFLIFDTHLKTYQYHKLTVTENGKERKIKLCGFYFNPLDTHHVWVATWGDGLLRLNTSTFTYESFKFKKNLPINISNIVFQIAYCDTNKLWILNEDPPAIFDMQKHTFIYLYADNNGPNAYPKLQTSCMFIEDKNRIWFGHFRGVSVLDKSLQLFSITKLKPRSFPHVLSWDASSQRYYSTSFYSNRSMIIYNKNFDLLASYPMPFLDKSLAEAYGILKTNEGVWIGTSCEGVYLFDETKKEFKHIATPLESDGTPNPCVTYIMKDRNNYLWFSCYYDGIMNYNPATKKFAHYPIVNETGDTISKNLDKIIDLDNEHLALHFNEHGYGIFNKRTFKTKIFCGDDKNFRVLNSSCDLIKNKDGKLFSITREHGIVEVTGNKYVCYNTIGDEPVKALFSGGIADSLNNIWMGSTDGFYRFNIASKILSHFGSAYGLNDKIFNSELVSHDAKEIATIYDDNNIYKFNPYDFEKEEKPPKLYFVSLKANGVSPLKSIDINYVNEIELSYDKNNLTIEFAELNFTNPGSSVFEYQLERANTQWNISGKNLIVNYSALPPGHYIFKVRSKTNSIASSSNEIRLQINIVPAWWQTWWFKVATSLLVIAITFFILRYIATLRYHKKIAALERQSEIEKVRSRIARDIHDDIGAGITKITLMARGATKSTNTETENAAAKDKINVASKELIQQLGEIIWTVNPDNDSIQNYFAFVRHYLNKQFDDTAINLHLDIPQVDEKHNRTLNPEIRRNTLLILKEAINNSLKYAGAKNISIKYIFSDDELILEISDDGKGFTTIDNLSQVFQNEIKLGGNGLKNMHKRTHEMNGQIEITSEKGTKIRLKIPV